MKYFRHSLISIIGAFLLLTTQPSHAQIEEQWEMLDGRILHQEDTYIAHVGFDSLIDWREELLVGQFAASRLNDQYEIYYRIGSRTDKMLSDLTVAERESLFEVIVNVDATEYLARNKILPVELVEKDDVHADLLTSLDRSRSKAKFKLQKKGGAVTLPKKTHSHRRETKP